MRKRVLIIYSVPTPYRDPLFERLSKRSDMSLTVFYMSSEAKNRIWDIDNNKKFNYKFLPSLTLNLKQGDDLYPIWINPTVFFEILFGNFEVVICTGWDSLTTFLTRIACLIKGVPFILWAGSTFNEKSWRRNLMNLPVKLLVKSANSFVVYGTGAKLYLQSLGAFPKKIFIAYNTVDTNYYQKESKKLKLKRQQLRKEYGIKNKYIVIFVGQLIERKGIKTLYQAIKKIKDQVDVGIVWVGYGKLKDYLEKTGEKDKIDQYFLTTKAPQETVRVYALADSFVLPSYEEVWGLVINEAMASGLPIISTDMVGASQDLIKDGFNGFVVKTGNSTQLANKILLILKNNKLREEMSDNSSVLIKKFNYRQNIKSFLQAINHAVG